MSLTTMPINCMFKFLTLTILLFVGSGLEVVYIDLTQSPKEEPSTKGGTAAGRGAAIYDNPTKTTIPPQATLPLALRVTQFVSSGDLARWKNAVEVTLTNTGTKPLSVPSGIDTKSLLATPGTNRRYLLFQVKLGENSTTLVGSGQIASSAEHPESSVALNPADYITVKIPLSNVLLANRLALQQEGNARVTATVTLFRVERDKGTDFHEQLSKTITSSNALKWLD